jgi:hypothetical protein
MRLISNRAIRVEFIGVPPDQIVVTPTILHDGHQLLTHPKRGRIFFGCLLASAMQMFSRNKQFREFVARNDVSCISCLS